MASNATPLGWRRRGPDHCGDVAVIWRSGRPTEPGLCAAEGVWNGYVSNGLPLRQPQNAFSLSKHSGSQLVIAPVYCCSVSLRACAVHEHFWVW